ncbi:MAG: hypothetical protein ABMA13_04520 [Chthoniobacteraceae bacterium]
MGGQACVFYGAAQVSKDIDLLLLTEAENFARLERALADLQARRIAVPRFDPALLARGHAVHFRCKAAGVEELRVDVMTRLRDLPGFSALWERRTTFADDTGESFDLLSVPDLVLAKKTQRDKDWPIIALLVDIHFRENHNAPTHEWVQFWLTEARSVELIRNLATRFPAETRTLAATRPLLALVVGDDESLRRALDEEVRAEQAKDRAYWEPLKREMEAFRREERL